MSNGDEKVLALALVLLPIVEAVLDAEEDPDGDSDD